MTRFKYLGIAAATVLAVGLGLGWGLHRWVAGQEPLEKPASVKAVTDGDRKTPNHLINEKSPYLLQHAYNPVEWYPWGDEAFHKARRENKPIFLSVGYSTCHWCHVMERESFSNGIVAAVMNQHFVNIKVDREERPDVDQVYMTFVQATTGSGGWPMSVFLTPQRKPFFGGTYFPPEERFGRPGFKELLSKIAEEWENNREAIVASAGKATEALKDFDDSSADGHLKLETELLDRTFDSYVASYDSVGGGFGQAPKFPRPVNLNFLLRYHFQTGVEKALEMTSHTLRQIARGGVRDHIGGGLHRYSTDNRWLVPHFEKMLYDQAQLAISYLETYQITGDAFFAAVARDILEYVLRDMTGEEGGFYSAEDADSPLSHESPEEHAEGAFYVWTYQEIVDLLAGDSLIFNHYYGVQKNGNVKRDPFGEFKNKNILHISESLNQTAEKFGQSVERIQEILTQSRQKLFEVRAKRPRPLRDDKVLTSWNGLMISALSKGYQVLREDRYLRAAEKAASFIADALYDDEARRLSRRYREGEVAIDGFVHDYAFLVQGLLDLYETSLDGRWLVLAMDLTETQNRLFWDQEKGGFYNTTGKDPFILIRIKEDYDGAEPSPNSVAILNLLRLSQMAYHKDWREIAEQSIKTFEKRLVQSPQSVPQLMVAMDFHLHKPKQIFIAGETGSADTLAVLQEVHKRFIPNKVVVLADGGEAQQRLSSTLDIVDSLSRIEGKATAYICENYVCQLPTNQVAVVAQLLQETPVQ